MRHEVNDAVGVARLVVIPRHKLDKLNKRGGGGGGETRVGVVVGG
jgi:hypothetical protein